MYTQFFFKCMEKDRFFFPSVVCYPVSQNHPDGGLAKNADHWVPPQTN